MWRSSQKPRLFFSLFLWLTLTFRVVSPWFHLTITVAGEWPDCCTRWEALIQPDTVASHPAHRKHLHLFGTRARLSAGTCWGRLRYAPAATGSTVGRGGRVCEGELSSRCSGWKNGWAVEQRCFFFFFLLRLPWRLGWAVTHLQAKPKTRTDSNGLTNDKGEQQIFLHTRERGISACVMKELL